MYKKLLDNFGKINVYEVNGEEVRRDSEPNFNNFACNIDFDIIPENELWLDVEMDPGEAKFYITRMLAKKRLFDVGYNKDDADNISNLIELNERQKSSKYKEYKDGNVTKELRLKVLNHYKDVIIYLVDGELVRDFFYEDFTEGGHHFVYPWIPEKEVWVDDDLKEDEIPDVVFHELFERLMMQDGETYDKAHMEALRFEWLQKKRKNA